MPNPIVARLYELLTGKPYITSRSMAQEFGPTIASKYPELANYSDAELLRADIAAIVKHIERMRRRNPSTAAAMERVLVGALSGRITGEQGAQVLEVAQ